MIDIKLLTNQLLVSSVDYDFKRSKMCNLIAFDGRFYIYIYIYIYISLCFHLKYVRIVLQSMNNLKHTGLTFSICISSFQINAPFSYFLFSFL